jgi:FkbM family methyltransferase
MTFSFTENKYGKYAIPDGMEELRICNRLMAGDIWEGGTLNFIGEQILSGDIIHAGAFIGDFIPALSSFVPNFKVIAFESSPTYYDACVKCIEINNITNVDMYNYAVGDEALIIRTREKNTDGSYIGGHATVSKALYRGNIDVNLVKIDDIVDQTRPVGLVHLDVEGFEPLAVKGCENIIRRYRPMLILEICKQLTNDQFCLDLFNELGYNEVGRVGGNIILTTND